MDKRRDPAMRGILVGIGCALIAVGFVLYSSGSDPDRRPTEVDGGPADETASRASSSTQTGSRSPGPEGIRRAVVESGGSDPEASSDPKIDFVLGLERLPPSEVAPLSGWLLELARRERLEAAMAPAPAPSELEGVVLDARIERLKSERRSARCESLAAAVARGEYQLFRSPNPHPVDVEGDVIWKSYRQFVIDGLEVSRTIVVGLMFSREPLLQEADRLVREAGEGAANRMKESGNPTGSQWSEVLGSTSGSRLNQGWGLVLPPASSKRFEDF